MKHFSLKGSLLSVAALVFALVGLALSNLAAAQPAAMPPCGPKNQLDSGIGMNVDASARCFELRMYTVDVDKVNTGDFNGGINELHQRFREEEVAIFEKHGAEVIGVWQDVNRPNTLIWMLAYRDLAHRDEVWAGFASDPAWESLRAKYNVPLQRPEIFMMSNTDYSHQK